MKLGDYLDQLEDSKVQALSLRLGRHRHYLRRISSGARKPSHVVALQIEQLTERKVRRWELRPDIWAPPTQSKANGRNNHRQRKARATA